jgi:hypothetical protein
MHTKLLSDSGLGDARLLANDPRQCARRQLAPKPDFLGQRTHLCVSLSITTELWQAIGYALKTAAQPERVVLMAILLAMPVPDPDEVHISPARLRYALDGELDSDDWLLVRWPGSPFPVLMRLGLSSEGRVVCSGLVLGGGQPNEPKVGLQRGRAGLEVSASSLRQIPLGALLEALSRRQSENFHLARLPEFQRPTRLGPRGIPTEKLAEVAELYRRGLAERPSAPVRWMAEQILGPTGKPTPEVTVRRWLQRCRDLGLLGPSIPGKAGEQPTTRPRRRRPR